MKKLLYSGLTALMMLFAFGSAKAQDEPGELQKPTFMVMDMQAYAPLDAENVARYGTLAVMLQNGGGMTPEVADGDDEEVTKQSVDVYYTFAADVELSPDNFANQGSDKKIFKAEDSYGAGLYMIDVYTDEDDVTLQVMVVVTQGEQSVSSDVASYELQFKEVPAPQFSETETTTVQNGTVINITNVPADGFAVYTTNGEIPVSSKVDPELGIRMYNASTGITITGDAGTTVTVKAIGYVTEDVDDEEVSYGSKMTAVTYTIAAAAPADDKVAKPTITPNGGVVVSGATVTIACATEDATIRYKKGEAEWADYSEAIAITEACTLTACAIKEGMTASDTVEVSFTIATKPAAPVFNVAEGAYNANFLITVAKGTADSIFVATGKTGETPVTFAVCKDEFFSVKLTADTVIRAYAMKDGEHSDTVLNTYTVKVTKPAYAGSKFVRDTEKVELTAGEDATIWYAIVAKEEDDFGGGFKAAAKEGEADETETTSPAPEWNQYPEGGVLLKDVKDLQFQIKACAVKGTESSDTVDFDFVLIDSIRWNVRIDTIVGMNYPLTLNVQSPNYWDYADIELPVHYYYTLDGTTEPSKEAFEAQAEGTETIKKLEAYFDKESYTRYYAYLMLTANVPTLKVKAYVQLDEEPAIWVPVETVTSKVRVNEIAAPVPSVPAGAVPAGIQIKLSAEPGAVIYYTVNGSEPLYNRILDNYEVEDEEIFQWYDYIMDFETWERLPNSITITKDTVIKAIAYITDGGVGGFATGTPAEGEPAGSQVVELRYTIDPDAILPPAMNVQSGYVLKGTELEITAEEGQKIFYTTNDSVPVLGKEYTKEYTGKIELVSNMTVKAIAMKEVEKDGKKDTVLSFVSTAAFQVYSWNLNPKAGDTVDDGTLVAVELIGIAEEDVEILSINFDMFATKKEAEDANYGDLYYVEGESQPELTVAKPVVKVFASLGYMTQLTPVIAEYTVLGEEPVKIDTIIFTFKPAPGEVEDGTKVTIEFSRELGEDEMVFFAMFADRTAADTCSEEDMLEMIKSYGEPEDEEDETTGYPVITKEAPVLKVGYIKGEDEEGNLLYAWTIAEYTVKKDGEEPSATEANELAGVSIYPNPTDGEFSVVAPVNAEVEIFTAAGVLVKRMVVAEGNAQVRLDNSGIYFVRVRANGQAAIRKVVVR